MTQLFTATTLAFAAAGAAFVVLLVCALKLWRENRHLACAIDNMPQGLCLFDPAGRIVVRNRTYLSMYDLSPKVVRRGLSLRELITHRKETGHFQGDIEQYCPQHHGHRRQGKVLHLDRRGDRRAPGERRQPADGRTAAGSRPMRT